MGKNHLERLLEIDRRIRNNMYPGRREIAEHFEVSIKTIERDIEYMKYRLNAPMKYDTKKRGYYYEEQGFYLPALYLSEGDALNLYMSHYFGTMWNGTSLTKTAESAMDKLSELFPETIEIDPITLSDNISFINPKDSTNPEHWLTLLKGATFKKKVKIEYHAPGLDFNLERTIHPYTIINHHYKWYVSCYTEEMGDLRNYSLNRIVKAEILEEFFKKDEEKNPLEGMDPNFGIYRNGEKFSVRIKTDARMTDILTEQLNHYRTIPQHDKSKIIEFETNQSEELLYWVLKWGDKIEVLEPESIREKLVVIGKYYSERYEK